MTPGETWVPLVEKAWAKLHGDYASVMYGRTCDAIEDMTGYVFSFFVEIYMWVIFSDSEIIFSRGVSNLILTKVH